MVDGSDNAIALYTLHKASRSRRALPRAKQWSELCDLRQASMNFS